MKNFAEIDPNLIVAHEVTALEIEERYLADHVEVTAADVSEPSSLETVQNEDTVYNLSSEECRLLAALVTLEVGAETYECQKAVVSVVLNRMYTGNMTLHEVIYQKYQFSVAPKVKTTKPFESCIQAVDDVLTNGTTLPTYVTFFRAGHYHDWGDRYVSYKKIDKTYFSYDKVLKEKWS